MGLIDPQLTHRATLYRSVMRDNDGYPVATWSAIRTNIPCLFTIPEVELNPEYDAPTAQVAATTGHLLVRATEDIRAGDWLIITRPSGFGKLKIITAGAPIPGPNALSHKRFAARWTVGALGSNV